MKNYFILFICLVISFSSLAFSCDNITEDCGLPPIAAFSYKKEDPTNKNKITFDASKTKPQNPGGKPSDLKYVWSFGGEGTQNNFGINSIKPIFTYNKPGAYQVKLTVTNIKNQKSSSITKSVIAGNSDKTIEFSEEQLTVSEASSEISISIVLAKKLTTDLTVNLSYIYETASSSDHELMPESIVIKKDEQTGTLKFKPVNDKFPELGEGLVIKIISTSDPLIGIGEKQSLILNISDDDGGGSGNCGGAPGAPHINPNGTPGGFVSNDSYVSPLINIPQGLKVCNNSQINGGPFLNISSGVILSEASITGGFTPIEETTVTGQVEINNSAVHAGATVDGANGGSVKLENFTGVSGKVSGNVVLNFVGVDEEVVIKGQGLKLFNMRLIEQTKINAKGSIDGGLGTFGVYNISGSVFIEHLITLTGTTTISGKLKVKHLITQDDVSITGNIEAREIRMFGTSTIRGNIQAPNLTFRMGEKALIDSTIITNVTSFISAYGDSKILEAINIRENTFLNLYENARIQGTSAFKGLVYLFGNVKIGENVSINGPATFCFDETITEDINSGARCNRPLPIPPIPPIPLPTP